MRSPLGWFVVLAVVSACGDDGGGKKPPETTLDETPPALSNQLHVRITFHAEGTANMFKCTLDDGLPSTCVPPFEQDATEGSHTFSVAAGIGSVYDESPASYTWKIDATPPDTTLVDVPAALDNTVAPTLTFTGSDPGGGQVTFECKLDGSAFAACMTPNMMTLADGAHAFEVRAVDAAGNADPTPATHAWTIDSSTPDTAIIAGPGAGATTQPSGSFSFSSPVAATFECQLDAASFATCTSPMPFTGLADGSHTFSVRSKNASGTFDPTPATRTWTVDGTAPTVTIPMHPADPSNDPTPTFAFNSPDATATFQCQVDTTAFATCTSPLTTAALTDGSHTFRVHATDLVGNVGADATFTWVVDTMAPTVTITSGPSGLMATGSATYAFTTAGAPIAIECSLDSAAFAVCTSPKAYAALGDGMHTFVVRATDSAGNTGMDMRTFTVDTMPPVVTITTAPTNPTADNTPTFAFTVTGATTIECTSGGAFAACTSPITLAAQADGSHTFTVRAFDAAGNTASDSRTYVVDTTPPTVTIIGKPTNPSNVASPSFTFTVSEGSPTCKLDGGAFAACTSPKGYTNLADGSHTFTVQAADALGNIGSATYTWSIDTVGPTVTITSSPTNPTANQTPVIGFTVSADAVSQTCKTDSLPATACSPPSYTTPALADGSHTILITAVDALGNPGAASVTFTVDHTGPVIIMDTVPPAQWAVNYFDFAWHANETATYECSLNGAAFAACTSPRSITTTYAASTFAVRGKDTLGNVGNPLTTTWTPATGLVLKYGWEQGSTRNTSLLSQIPALSPNGSVTLPVVGGWGGTAITGVAAHTYANTIRPLSSAPNENYTASAWFRATQNANGILWSTANGTTGGHTVRINGGVVTLDVFENGQAYSVGGQFNFGAWAQIEVVTTGTSKGAQLYIDGASMGTAAAPSKTGFGAGQATNLTVGPFTGVELDDLRFHNTSYQGTTFCQIVQLGVSDANANCVFPRPELEFNFEGAIVNSGGAGFNPPTTYSFVPGKLGQAIKFGAGNQPWPVAYRTFSQVGHTISMWVAGSSPADTLLDFTGTCPQSTARCGISIKYLATHQFQVFTAPTATNQVTSTIPAQPLSTTASHSILVAESTNGAAQSTLVRIYVDGVLQASLPSAGGQAIAGGGSFGAASGTSYDELQLWPLDLAGDNERLCTVGFDGDFNFASQTCALTSN